MNRYYHAIRQPVRRPRVEEYLLLTLLSFALSVSLTRLFLALTGYPQLGGGDLHISHVLWGGLFLFIAAMLPIIWANRWVYRVGAIFAGVGIGLFIDEVGKFITQSYDYFFPPAAPIVYAFFLICVLIYLQFARPGPRRARSELYAVLEMMEEILDHDLNAHEQAEIITRLTFVAEQDNNPELTRLASELLDFFDGDQVYLAPDPPDRLQKLNDQLQDYEARYLDQGRFRTLLGIGIGGLGLISMLIPILSLIDIVTSGSDITPRETSWLIILQAVQILTGLALIIGSILIFSGRESTGFRISYIILLVYLTILDLFLFYYYQFATIPAAIFQFLLLLGVLYYQQRYLQKRTVQ
jgi:hypothetical protein